MTAPSLIETIRVRSGRAPLLERHEARLRRSGVPEASLSDLVSPYLTHGDLVLRVDAGPSGLTISTRAAPRPDAPPLRVMVAATRHTPYPRKTTARAAFDAAQAEARAAGTDDALLLTADGMVGEGTVWNLFWWDGAALVTPSLDVGVLPGVARERVRELVRVTERAVPLAALTGRSLFATNAVRGVFEIASLNGTAVPRDERTAALAARFWP